MSALGKRMVLALLNGGDLATVYRAGVDRTCLRDDAVVVFDWSVMYFERECSWPTPNMVTENTGIAFDLDRDPEPLEYVVDLVRRRRLGFELTRVGERLASRIKAREIDEALVDIEAAMSRLKSMRRRVGVYSFVDEAPARIRELETRGLAPLPGLLTRWPSLNRMIQGLMNGTLNVIVAMTQTGKSWFLCLIAEDTRALGKRVLFITLEMPVASISRRLDALRHKIPFGDLRSGKLDWFSIRRWAADLEADPGGGDILIADKSSVVTVSDAAALCKEYQPDLVVVDGGYRFRGSGSSHWEKTVDIVDALQTEAEASGVPWVVSSQMGDSHETGKPKKKSPDGKRLRAWNVRYGKEWLINPDTVVGLFMDPELLASYQLGVEVLKMRDADSSRRSPVFYIHWNVDAHTFDEITDGVFGSDEDSGDGPLDF